MRTTTQNTATMRLFITGGKLLKCNLLQWASKCHLKKLQIVCTFNNWSLSSLCPYALTKILLDPNVNWNDTAHVGYLQWKHQIILSYIPIVLQRKKKKRSVLWRRLTYVSSFFFFLILGEGYFIVFVWVKSTYLISLELSYISVLNQTYPIQGTIFISQVRNIVLTC